MLKTPISYYGGKQMMVKTIDQHAPKDYNLYTEAYLGGGAYFWFKEPSPIEVINDLNGEVINFFSVLQNDHDKLRKMIYGSLHSRKMHQHAQIIYNNPDLFDPVTRAWALWFLANQSFSCMLDGSWGYDKSHNSMAKKMQNIKGRWRIDYYKERLENTQIECNDAIKVISSRDKKDAFHYIDTPYFNSDCGHYGGYTIQHFEAQLKCCEKLQGKFLLSNYPSEILTQYAEKNGWYQLHYIKNLAVTGKAKKGEKRTKIEVLTANYPISKEV